MSDKCHKCGNPLLGEYYSMDLFSSRKFHKLCFWDTFTYVSAGDLSLYRYNVIEDELL